MAPWSSRSVHSEWNKFERIPSSRAEINRSYGTTTRSAFVDSFGLGMTLFFLRTGREPEPQQHLHKSWVQDVTSAIGAIPCGEWHSIPARYSRLILNATRHHQSDRWDMGQIEGELALLKQAQLNPESVGPAEFMAEELAQRIVTFSRFPAYSWDSDTVTASLSLASGVEIRIAGIESNRSVRLQVEWTNLGQAQYKNVRKYLKPAMDQAIEMLVAKGWKKLAETRLKAGEAAFALQIECEELSREMEAQSRAVARVAPLFQFK